MTNSDATAAGAPAEKAGFFREWVVPVALGLAIGGALVYAWRHSAHLFRSDAWNIVARLSEEETADVEKAEKDLHALGPSARSDLVAVLRDLPSTKTELKAWVAGQLAGEPWFDTTSLKEIVRDATASKEDRRAAAGALVSAQVKEVDTNLVLPVLEEWLLDTSSLDRPAAVSHVDNMWFNGMLGSAWEQRMTKALRKMAERTANVSTDDAERIDNDRGTALHALSRALAGDDETKSQIVGLLSAVALDETDSEFPRMSAVQGLADGGYLDAASLPTWEKIAKVKDGVVRQTVVDNLYKTNLPEFDKVLEPLQFDERNLTRFGAIGTQIKRRRPTMLARFDELVEDSEVYVRSDAMFACGVFKNQTEGLTQRAAMILRVLETSDQAEDVKGAILAMKLLTEKVYGVAEPDVHVNLQTVDDTAIATFMADKAGRKDAAAKWREHFGASCVWTDGDREKTLQKLLTHADPKNVERAKAELAAMKKQ